MSIKEVAMQARKISHRSTRGCVWGRDILSSPNPSVLDFYFRLGHPNHGNGYRNYSPKPIVPFLETLLKKLRQHAKIA